MSRQVHVQNPCSAIVLSVCGSNGEHDFLGVFLVEVVVIQGPWPRVTPRGGTVGPGDLPDTAYVQINNWDTEMALQCPSRPGSIITVHLPESGGGQR